MTRVFANSVEGLALSWLRLAMALHMLLAVAEATLASS
jgi:hypothetical protein